MKKIIWIVVLFYGFLMCPITFAADANQPILLKNINQFKDFRKIGYVKYHKDYYQQGACYDAKRDRILLGVVKDGIKQQKILVVNPHNWAIEKEYDFSNLGHMNTMTYCPKDDMIYVFTQLTDDGKHAANTSNIVTLDAKTLSKQRKIKLGQKIDAIDYDKKRKQFVAVRCNPEKEPFTLYLYDRKFKLKERKKITKPFKTVGNGFAIDDGRFIHLSLAGMIEGDSLGKIIKSITVDFPKEEPEDAFWIGDKCYFVRPVGVGYTEIYLIR